MVNNSNEENRHNLSKAKAEFTKFLKLKDSISRQKDRVIWLSDSDANTSFFHAVIKNKRKKLNIQKRKMRKVR